MTEKKFQNGSYKVDDVTNHVKNWPKSCKNLKKRTFTKIEIVIVLENIFKISFQYLGSQHNIQNEYATSKYT